MKRIITTILFFLITISYGQKLDSLQFEYGQLYFHTYGQGNEILILSGGPGNDVKSLNDIALNLSKENKVILLEQRGTGMSLPTKFDKTSLSIDLALEDINAVLDKLEIDKITLLGHSYGASLATIFTSKYPEKVKSLILVSPGIFNFDSGFISFCNIISRLGKKEAIRLEELLYKSYSKDYTQSEKEEYNMLMRQAYFYDKSKVDYYLKQMKDINNSKTQEIINNDLITYNFDLEKGLKNISSPINIISGRQDIFDFMAYEYKIAKPTINLHWIDQSGHFPMFETSNEFYKIVEKILN